MRRSRPRRRALVSRGLRPAALLLAWCLAPAPAAAVQPEDAPPGPPYGEFSEADLIPESPDAAPGGAFRKPGTLLDQASHNPRQVDPDALRSRKLDLVAHRTIQTHALPPLPPPEKIDPVVLEDPLFEVEVIQASAGLRTWHVLVFLALTAAALVGVVRFTGRRR